MASIVTFSGPFGADPVARLLEIKVAVHPTVGDALWAGLYLYAKIRERTGQGIDVQGVPFAPYSEGYRRRKTKELGHADTVDLFGYEHHPHMLNTVMVKAGAQQEPGGGRMPNPSEFAEPIDLFHVGFYGEEAIRARVHNEGSTKMPQRHYFDANQEERTGMENGMGERALIRVKRGQ